MADSQLQRAVEIMDRLRSPGGCPWDAAQTHSSLTRYLLEETYEVLEAIETGDRALLREELGDLLLQVLFHARIAEELPPDLRFDIEDIAGDLVAKLISRHPHVFADMQVASVEEQTELWEQLKVAEKGRISAVDGVPLTQPALALAAKLISRAGRADPSVRSRAEAAVRSGAEAAVRSGAEAVSRVPVADADPAADIGARLFALVREAVDAGIDPEAALRQTARGYRDAIRAAEADGRPAP